MTHVAEETSTGGPPTPPTTPIVDLSAVRAALESMDKTTLRQLLGVTEPATTVALAEDDRKLLQDAITARKQEATRTRISTLLAGYPTLSDFSKRKIEKDYNALAERREWEDDELKSEATALLEHEASLRGPANLNFVPGRASISMRYNSKEKMDLALLGLFLKEDQNEVPRFKSIQEAWCTWHGVNAFEMNIFEVINSFGCKYDSSYTHTKVRESLMTSTWGEVFADNMHMSVIRRYGALPYASMWTQLVSEYEDVNDFRTRHWTRIGGYGDLAGVNEGQTYPMLSTPGDEEVTYTISKYGGLDELTMESFFNDRAGQISNLTQSMANSAARTLFKFVTALITANPTMGYDSVALFHNGSHGNDGTTALSISGVAEVVQKMRDQQAFGQTEPLGPQNYPKILMVPNELENLANRIVDPSDAFIAAIASSIGTTSELDPATYKGKGITVFVNDFLTDVNNWWVIANPATVPTIVMGFLGGRREPELFVQDAPNVGSGFTADKILYKIRHIYGGAILDHRSFYRNVVA